MRVICSKCKWFKILCFGHECQLEAKQPAPKTESQKKTNINIHSLKGQNRFR